MAATVPLRSFAAAGPTGPRRVSTMAEPFNKQGFAPASLLISSSFPPLLPRLASTLRRNNRGAAITYQHQSSLPPLQADFGLPSATVSDPLPRSQQSASSSRAGPRADPPSQSTQQPPTGAMPLHPTLSKSYREVVAGLADKVSAPTAPTGKEPVNVSFSSIRHNPLSSHQGEPALILSKEEEEKRAHSFQYTLVGKFSNGKPSMVAIRKELLAASFAG